MIALAQANGSDISSFVVIVGVVVFLFFVAVWWKIFAKAGYSGLMGLLIFIPIVNIIPLLILAFGEWPVHRELRLLRERSAQAPVANVYYPPQQR